MAPLLDHGRAGARCPRCGYDLRGLVAAWSKACPLQGRCGECGLEFAWRTVLDESASRPRRHIEFAPRWNVLPAAICTAATAVVPWRFWSAMRMTFALQPRRLALYLLLLAAGCYLCFAIGHAALVDSYWAWFTPDTRWQVDLHAALMPFSAEPIEYSATNCSRQWPVSPRGLLASWHPAVCALLMTTAIALACPLSLTALVATRRQAGVRGAHIVRIAACSAPWLAATWLGLVVETVADQHGMGLPIDILDWLLLAGSPVWLLLWWQAAIHHYLRLPHAWATATAITVIGVLCGVHAAFTIDGRLADYIFWRFGLLPA